MHYEFVQPYHHPQNETGDSLNPVVVDINFAILEESGRLRQANFAGVIVLLYLPL